MQRESTEGKAALSYASIALANDQLDVVLRPTGEYLELKNSNRDIRKLVKRLRKEDLGLIVLEATGDLE
jgi:hypothetical protein